MGILFGVWLASAGVVGLGWIAAHWAIGYAQRRRKILTTSDFSQPPSPAPRLSVLVAAKDEEANIETCIASLFHQDYPDYEIIAIDDRSGDATPAVLARLASSSGGKLKVLRVAELPAGWFGKNNAMRLGAEHATGRYLCFVDADCRQMSRRSLSTAVAFAMEHRTDFLSINPTLIMPRAWERIIQPVCASALLVWFPQHKVNKKSKAAAYANGQFMLLRREAYDALGGHHRVRGQMNEDIHLARFAKQAGLRLRIADGEDIYETRMYVTPREAYRGWSRIFCGSIGSVWKLLASAAWFGGFAIGAWLSFVAAVVGLCLAGAGRAGAWWWAVAAWGVVMVLMHSAAARVYRTFRLNAAWSLAYPLAACAAMAIMISAIFKAVGAAPITWRGTTYRVAKANSQ